MYNRLLKKTLQEKFFCGKALIIVGARQTGKTTLTLDLIKDFKGKLRVFNCDNPTDRELLSDKNLEFLKPLVADADIILIDEGQKVNNIGQTIKLIVDYYKNQKQILATGSSTLHLLDSVQESLTGRKYVYHLFPLSLEEIYPDKDQLKFLKEIEMLLIFGMYPEIVKQKSFAEKIELLQELSSSYLYKDILEFQEVKNPNILMRLIKALALQIGAEVSYTELANLLGIDKKTVERYIDLLEKSFVVFRLSPYTKNKRREIAKLKKIYFYDLGVRNTVINNFNFLENRADKGALWENFLIIERLKYRSYHKIYTNQYFWRTYDGSEIDLVEEREEKLYGYEFKWSKQKIIVRKPVSWDYPNSSYKIITPSDIRGFVL